MKDISRLKLYPLLSLWGAFSDAHIALLQAMRLMWQRINIAEYNHHKSRVVQPSSEWRGKGRKKQFRLSQERCAALLKVNGVFLSHVYTERVPKQVRNLRSSYQCLFIFVPQA